MLYSDLDKVTERQTVSTMSVWKGSEPESEPPPRIVAMIQKRMYTTTN